MSGVAWEKQAAQLKQKNLPNHSNFDHFPIFKKHSVKQDHLNQKQWAGQTYA